MPRRRAAEGALLVGVALVGVSVLSTWTVSGRRERNGFETLESLDRLGVLSAPWDLVLVVVSASIPLLLALGAVGAATGRHRLLAAGCLGAATLLTVWALVVLRSPIATARGPWSALVAAFALGVATIATPRAQRRAS